MQKEEFEKIIADDVTLEEYELIEKVYAWHPAIKETHEGKEQIAELYQKFGMTVIKDMQYRADEMERLDQKLKEVQKREKELREEKEKVSGWQEWQNEKYIF